MKHLAGLFRLFTWWNRQTPGTRTFTRRFGERVGEDGSGAVYYRDRADKRRWVIFPATVEASAVPPAWRSWLTHTRKEPPLKVAHHPWERPHEPNRTGEPDAWHPGGSLNHLRRNYERARSYEAWTPEQRSRPI